MNKKILIVSPEIPNGSGGGRYFWQLAEAGSKYSDWETYLISPMFQSDVAKAGVFDGFRKTTGRKLKLYEKEKAEQLLSEAYQYHIKENFDMVYICSEIEIKEKAFYLDYFDNVVMGIHDHVNYLDNYDNTKPIYNQLSTIKRSKALEDFLSYSNKVNLFHVISRLEEKIWQKLAPEHFENTLIYPNMAAEMEYYGLPWEERTDEIMFAGRIQTYAKGLAMVRKLLEMYPNRQFKITVPFGSIAKAKKFFDHYPNCNVSYLTNHEDVLREMGRHKVFVNPGTYGPFDLTTFEASAQKCQIVMDECIGSCDFIKDKTIPGTHTPEGFMWAIDFTLEREELSDNLFPQMKYQIQDFFDTLYRNCEARK